MIFVPNCRVSSCIYESSKSLIFKGVRESDQLPLVLKVLKQDYPDTEDLNRYREEYAIISSLDLDGVIKCYGLETYQNSLVMLLEDFGGESLAEHMKRLAGGGQAGLDLSDFLWISIQTTAVLGEIHASGVMHGDINPANIVCNLESKQIKMIDFGFASRFSRETPLLQQTASLQGSLAYLSPEQTGRMNRPVDYRTDFYSLGVTLYELLTGRLPFMARDPLELVHCHIAVLPTPPCEVNPRVPIMLSDLVMKLLAKNPEDRYQSAWGVQADLVICQQQWQNRGAVAAFSLAEQDVSDRFVISKKLYGRAQDIESLLSLFDQVVGTADSSRFTRSALCLVTGYSGIGKTALVQEIHKPITKRGAYFISGKFDQLQKHTPYSGLVQALSELVRQLLGETEERLHDWRERLSIALDENGQLMIDVIPELEFILGPQPAVVPLWGQAARNRFDLTFQQFIRACCRPEHPLVIFLDDLQWVDSATLNWFHPILTDPQISSLLLLGSYRKNEVGTSHPLMSTLKLLRDHSVRIHEIVVQPLGQAQVSQLIAETLHSEKDSVHTLAEIVWHKTAGNPFFIQAFLELLYAEGLIRFDRQSHEWCWEMAHIAAQGITENVVELMMRRLQHLPVSTQNILQLAACLGSQFSLTQLAIASEQDPTGVYADLYPAIHSDIVVPQSPLELEGQLLTQGYHFGHDRIQQAAYAMITAAERDYTHLKIGELLVNNIPLDQQEEHVFEIVYQLNYGLAFSDQRTQRERIARLNLIAGRKAKASTAYQAALAYLQSGIDWLAADCWETDYDLTLALHEAIAEAALLSGDFAQVQHWVETVLTHAKTEFDTIKAYEVKIYAYTAQKRLQEAIQTGITALERFGFALPAAPTEDDVRQAIADTSGLLGKAEIAELVDLPEMSDPAALAAMRISYCLAAPAYMASPRHFCLSALREIQTSVRYGNAPMSAASYAHYAIILCGVMQDIEKGYRFGKLAFELANRYQDKALNAKVALVTGTFVLAWKLHPRDTLELLRQGAQDGMLSGDLQAAVICRYSDTLACFVIGQELLSLDEMLDQNSQEFRRIRQESHVNLNDQLRQLVLNLLGRSTDPCRLSGDAVDETKLISQYRANENASGLYILYLYKLMLCYLFGRYSDALANAELAAPYEAGVTAQVIVPLWYFYDALTRLALASEHTTASEGLLAPLSSHQEKLKHWATHAPQNFQHKYDLIQAEWYRIKGEWLEAMACYDAAINAAKANGYIQDEALANELAARFYLAQGRTKIAAVYLQDAYYAYVTWGAVAKVEALKASYPQFFNQNATASRQDVERPHANPPATDCAITSNLRLDAVAIVQALRTLSEEILLSRLLKKLMQIILESAGAEQGLLLLEENDEWCIRAEGKINHEIEVLKCIPIKQTGADRLIPQSLIQYVIHSRENVVLDDAGQAKQFLYDPYITAHRPKSVLCVPLLHRGELRAIVYLENNLTTMAFIQSRVELVKLLCAQASISLENARLYAEQSDYTHLLEDRVAERTAELKQANQELEHLANLDGLTQIANRRRYDEFLAQEWKRLAREQQPLTLILCDVDHFKQYNDLYGHQQGDDCLKKIASVLHRMAIRPADLVARYGGEEFVLVLPFTGEAGARKVSNKIQQAIRELYLPHAQSDVSQFITLSLGVATMLPSLDISPAILVKHADTALYEAKRRGRNRWVYLLINDSVSG